MADSDFIDRQFNIRQFEILGDFREQWRELGWEVIAEQGGRDGIVIVEHKFVAAMFSPDHTQQLLDTVHEERTNAYRRGVSGYGGPPSRPSFVPLEDLMEIRKNWVGGRDAMQVSARAIIRASEVYPDVMPRSVADSMRQFAL